MIPVERFKQYTVRIEGVSSDGSGVARVEGYTVFVPYTAAGDTALIEITDTKPRFGTGRLVEIIEPSADRIEPKCAAYSECGGCRLMHMNYAAQLRAKQAVIENAMRRIGGFKSFELSSMTGMENPLRYRNKMIFRTNGDRFGFYESGSHKVVPVDDCLLGGEINGKIIRALTEYLSENDAAAAAVRGIFTRVSAHTGEAMAVVLANTAALPDTEALVSRLRGASDKIVSVILNVNKKQDVHTLGDKNITLYGKNTITDYIGRIKFEISPQSFFQVNPIQTEKLYEKAVELAAPEGKTVMDIYCGIGTISLCAAETAKKVIGVEIVERAVKDARRNAALNGVNNAFFYAGAAEKLVPRMLRDGERADTVILDPPRKGSDALTLAAIADAAPERIVYVSCNPATLARDAKYLAGRGYAIKEAHGFDMFPHTAHVETVCLLSKLKSSEHTDV